jgi:hypothetical protein
LVFLLLGLGREAGTPPPPPPPPPATQPVRRDFNTVKANRCKESKSRAYLGGLMATPSELMLGYFGYIDSPACKQ